MPYSKPFFKDGICTLLHTIFSFDFLRGLGFGFQRPHENLRDPVLPSPAEAQISSISVSSCLWICFSLARRLTRSRVQVLDGERFPAFSPLQERDLPWVNAPCLALLTQARQLGG